MAGDLGGQLHGEELTAGGKFAWHVQRPWGWAWYTALSDEPHKEGSQCEGRGQSAPLPRYLGPLKFEGLGSPALTRATPVPLQVSCERGQRLSQFRRQSVFKGKTYSQLQVIFQGIEGKIRLGAPTWT